LEPQRKLQSRAAEGFACAFLRVHGAGLPMIAARLAPDIAPPPRYRTDCVNLAPSLVRPR
jgi:hypothetical protein